MTPKQKQTIMTNSTSQQEKLNTIAFYNRNFIEQLESLTQSVKEGEKSPNQIAKTIETITQSLRELNNL